MELSVHRSEKGMRLDRFLRIHAPRLPAATVLLRDRRLTVDGRPARATDRLEPGQVVRVAEPAAAAPPPAASPEDAARLAAMTIWTDGDVLVLDKPSGLAAHPGTRTTDDLDSLLARFPDADGRRPCLVNRLDKDTSGLIVAVRSRDLLARLGRAFAGHDVEKTYLAVVEGVPEPASGRIDRPLKKVATPRGGRMVEADPHDPDALTAATRWEVVAGRDGGRSSLVRLMPESGRQHQLRVHTRLLGHPILGDRLYGHGDSAPRLMLHAHRLRLPLAGSTSFEAPLPPEFAGAAIVAPAVRES